MPVEDTVKVVAVVPKLKGGAFQAVTDGLRAKGLEIDSADDLTGLVTGSATENKITALSEVPGVTFVRKQRQVRIASD